MLDVIQAKEATQLPTPEVPEYPVFFTYLDNCLSHASDVVQGTINTPLQLDNGQKILLLDNYIEPMLSVIATVQYLYTDYEGIVYQYTFHKSDVGVPSINF